MIKVDVRSNMSAAFRAVDELSNSTKAWSVARALNRAAITVRKTARQEIRGRYNIDNARIDKILKIREANQFRLEASVYAKDRRLALSAFGRNALVKKYDRLKAGKAIKAISVKVLRDGGMKRVTGKPEYEGEPFLQVVGKGNHLGIFQRSGDGRRFRELMSVSIPGALVNKAIQEALTKVAVDRFVTELTRDLKFRTSRGK